MKPVSALVVLSVFVFLCVGVAAGCSPSLQDLKNARHRSRLLAALPEDGDVPPWKRYGSATHTFGLEELSTRMEGAAPFYVERGVQESVFQDYEKGRGAAWLTVVLHRSEKPRQAAVLYRDLAAESPVSVDGLGDEARVLPNLIGVYALEMRQGAVVALLTATGNSAASRNAVRAFAEAIARKLPGAKRK